MVYNDKCLFDSDDDQEPPTKVPKGAVLQSNGNQWHSNFAESHQAQGVVTTPYHDSQKASAGTSQSDAIRFLPNQLETPATMMVGQGRNTPSNGISAQSNFNQGILASLYQDSQLASLGTTQMDDKGFQPVQNKKPRKHPSTNRLSENLGNFSFEVLLDKLKEQLETPTNQEEFIMEVASLQSTSDWHAATVYMLRNMTYKLDTLMKAISTSKGSLECKGLIENLTLNMVWDRDLHGQNLKSFLSPMTLSHTLNYAMQIVGFWVNCYLRWQCCTKNRNITKIYLAPLNSLYYLILPIGSMGIKIAANSGFIQQKLIGGPLTTTKKSVQEPNFVNLKSFGLRQDICLNFTIDGSHSVWPNLSIGS
ncbi:hypothetical protein BY996DRAFT_6416965 [Phakopsora pachyrhizi]|nr:hypothetical protein BY996DRAFT_6416965 [Phakopsora pachyrhizi]